MGAARGKPRSAIKILTVLNGVSGNALGKGTAGAFGACGATLPTLYKGHDGKMLTPGP